MATKGCDYKLAADMVADCANSSVGGIKNHGVIVNFDDIDFDSCSRSEDNRFIIDSMVLKSGKKGYRIFIPGKKPFSGTNTAMVDGTYRKKFTKSIGIVILDNGPEVVRDIIDPLANGKFVVILENQFAGKDKKNTFQVFGFEQGLSATALTDDKYSEETDGGWAATLEESQAPSPALYLFNEDVATTRTALDSIVAGAAGGS